MLSGGQRQRVAMGRAIVRHPSVFLMDEPLSNLDAKLRVQMRAELKLLNERLGVTTLYVTHDQVEAMTMGDRVAVLKPVRSESETNLQQIDTPQALYDRPANMFVAGFIGSPAMNFLSVDLRRDGDGLLASVAGTDLAVPVPPAALARRPGLAAFAGRDVVLGARPEAFTVVPAGEAFVEAEILVIEALGADNFVFFEIASPPVVVDERAEETGTRPTVTRLTARIAPHQAPRRGERLPLALDPTALHWFDPRDGAAIR
jgi:multiple sugar transport system ATP-binding protein